MTDEAGGPVRVFVFYAHEDQEYVQRLLSELRRRTGLIDLQPSEMGANLSQQMLDEVTSSDAFVILLSQASLRNQAVLTEVGANLERRGADLVGALLERCPIPDVLRDRTVVSLDKGVDELIDRLDAGSRVNLGRLTPAQFEDLVSDLLVRRHFALIPTPPTPDQGYDLEATSMDPDGKPVRYLVQVKSYTKARPSVHLLREFAAIVAMRDPATHGLFVTNSQVTSAGAETLQRLKRDSGIQLNTLEGPRLKSLLLEYPDLVETYFPRIPGDVSAEDAT